MATEELIQQVIRLVALAIEVSGVLAVVSGVLATTVRFVLTLENESGYRRYRSGLGRAILLGLELLVAADIIRTVAIRPTYESVGVLGLIVMIRTFLSFSLEVEISGRWPWQAERQTTP